MSDHARAYQNAGPSVSNFGSWWGRCKFKILFVLLVAVITGARKRIYTSQCLFLSSSDAPGRPMYMTMRTRTRYAVEGALSVSGSGNQNLGLCDIFSNDSRLRKIEFIWRRSLFIGKLVSRRESLADRGWGALRRTRFGLFRMSFTRNRP